MTQQASRPDTGSFRHLRALSVAGRLLSGAGRASWGPGDCDPDEVEAVVAHGVLTTRRLALAVREDGAGGAQVLEPEARVRIDKFGTLPQAHLVTASLHLVGRARRVGSEELHRWSEEGMLPGLVSLAASVGGCAVVEVDVASVLVHDADGMLVFATEDVVDFPCFPLPADECDAVELVRTLGAHRLARLSREVCADRRPGRSGPALPIPRGWERLAGQTLVVDVDTAGCLLLQIGACHSRTVFLPFDLPVGSAAELRERVEGLAGP